MTIKDLVEQGTVLYNKGDVGGFCAMYREDGVLITPDGRFEGRETIRPYVQSLFDAFPSGGISLGRMVENGDLYFGEFMLDAVNTGPLAMPDGSQLPATQLPVRLDATEIVQVENGMIVRHDMLWDNMGFFGQLGLLPSG
jgi:ketosteroid isomerase-like protein